jgi:flagellar hook-basal body complex protein FliE
LMRENFMSTQDKARELMVQQRQHDEHLHESMLNRAEAAHPGGTEALTQEEARELMAQQRYHEKHLHESMLNRAEAEVGFPDNETDSSQECRLY